METGVAGTFEGSEAMTDETTRTRAVRFELLCRPGRQRVGCSRFPRPKRAIANIAIALSIGVLFIPNATAQTPKPTFDHDLTRFPLTGRHEYVTCESCHRGGLFEGTSTSCNICHAGGADHAETAASPNHISIQTSCSDCHTTRFWEPARMDHNSVGDDCGGCHSGGMASGKSPGHIASSNRCGDCHGTNRWTGARFDHAAITGSCISCHNGSIATGKNSGHLDSSNECDICHSTQRWVPAGFDHSAVSPGTCNTCHNGMKASGLPSGHFMTTLSCDGCHGTNRWTPASYDHAGTAYPGDHRVSLDCIDCHGGNSDMVTWSSPTYQPDCAGCHANDFKPGGPHETATVSDLRDCAGACHKPSEHSVRDGDW
jgi:hypothetical protein